MSTLPAPEIAGVGLTYKVSTVEKISAWSRVVQSLMGSKWMTTIILGTFIDFEKIDSIVYGCYNCGSSASRNPVTYEMYCDNACEAGTLKTASIEITTTVNIRVDGGRECGQLTFTACSEKHSARLLCWFTLHQKRHATSFCFCTVFGFCCTFIGFATSTSCFSSDFRGRLTSSAHSAPSLLVFGFRQIY